jgi:hypothetical protein
VTRLRAGQPGFDSRHGQSFFFVTGSRSTLKPTQSPIQWVLGTLFPAVRAPIREVVLSLLSTAEVKNAWSYTSTPHMSLWRGA